MKNNIKKLNYIFNIQFLLFQCSVSIFKIIVIVLKYIEDSYFNIYFNSAAVEQSVFILDSIRHIHRLLISQIKEEFLIYFTSLFLIINAMKNIFILISYFNNFNKLQKCL